MVRQPLGKKTASSVGPAVCRLKALALLADVGSYTMGLTLDGSKSKAVTGNLFRIFSPSPHLSSSSSVILITSY